MEQQMQLEITEQLTLLCDLLGITPQQVLQEFIHNLSLDNQSNGGNERMLAADYFLNMPYGREHYEWEDIQTMLEGLNWLRHQQYITTEKLYGVLKKEFLEQWYQQWNEKKKTGL